MTDTTDQTPADVDAETVANRAAQVITTMGAEIRTLKRERDRYRGAWRSARERAQAYGEGILRVVKDRESYQEWLRQAEDAASAAVVPAADRAALRDRLAAAIWERQNPGRRWADCEYRWRADAEEDADAVLAVLAVLPAPADRATVLLEAADRYQGFLDNADTSADPRYWTGIRDMVLGLRRMAAEATPVGASDAPANGTGAPVAAETPQPETCAHCGKHVRLITGTLTAWWVHDPGGNTVCHPQEAANSPRATPAAPAQPGKDTEADA